MPLPRLLVHIGAALALPGSACLNPAAAVCSTLSSCIALRPHWKGCLLHACPFMQSHTHVLVPVQSTSCNTTSFSGTGWECAPRVNTARRLGKTGRASGAGGAHWKRISRGSFTERGGDHGGPEERWGNKKKYARRRGLREPRKVVGRSPLPGQCKGGGGGGGRRKSRKQMLGEYQWWTTTTLELHARQSRLVKMHSLAWGGGEGGRWLSGGAALAGAALACVQCQSRLNVAWYVWLLGARASREVF